MEMVRTEQIENSTFNVFIIIIISSSRSMHCTFFFSL